MAISNPSFDDLLKENIILKKKLFETENDIQNLRVSQEKYFAIFDSALLGIAIAKEKKIVSVNKSLLLMFGYSEEELINKDYFEFFHPEELPALFERFIMRQRGETVLPFFQTRMLCKGGNVKYVELYTNYFISNDEQYILTTFIDITEKKISKLELEKAKEQLEEREKLFKAIFYTEPECVKIMNKDCTLQMMNPAGLSMIEVDSFEEVVGKSVLPLVSEEYRLQFQELTNRVFEEGYSGNLVFSLTGYKGTQRWLDTHAVPFRNNKGEITSLLAITRDVTENKKIIEELIKTKELAESGERKFKAIADTSPLAIYISSGIRQKASYINPTYIKLFGYEMEEISEAELWWPVAYPDETYRNQVKEEWMQKVEIAIKNKTDIEPVNALVTCKDGTVKNMLWGFVSTGEENWTFGLDLTEIKRVEKELIVAKEKAEESDKLKTAFLQNISHEVRTPMNAIIGFTKMLKKENLSKEKREQYIDIINSSTNQLLSIVDDVLTASLIETKQEKMSISATNINSLLKELHCVFEGKSTKNGNTLLLSSVLVEEQAVVMTDETKLRQILTNLISNSIKFTESGTIEFGCKIEDSCVKFFVKDNGIGISKEHHEKIFERFQQIDTSISRNYDGMGIGLSITKSFVELLGGHIWIESVLGVGAEFKFTIPFLQGNKVESGEVNFVKKDTASILMIVEDELNNYLFIEELLSDTNIKVFYARNGREAVDLFKNNPSLSLIIMDLKMPVMNGYEATKLIRQINSAIPIIAHTAYALPQDIELAKDYGFNEYLTKPVDQENLLELIAKYT